MIHFSFKVSKQVLNGSSWCAFYLQKHWLLTNPPEALIISVILIWSSLLRQATKTRGLKLEIKLLYNVVFNRLGVFDNPFVSELVRDSRPKR